MHIYIIHNQEALLSTVVFLGMTIGASFWGVLSDKKGRKFSLIGASVWVSMAGLLTGFAPSYEMLLGARLAVGVGLGGGHIAISMLMELLPTNVRGTC